MRKRKLKAYERETIINFNESDDTAYIFTYNKTWQKHLEDELGLMPVMDNGFGAKNTRLLRRESSHQGLLGS